VLLKYCYVQFILAFEVDNNNNYYNTYYITTTSTFGQEFIKINSEQQQYKKILWL